MITLEVECHHFYFCGPLYFWRITGGESKERGVCGIHGLQPLLYGRKFDVIKTGEWMK